MHKLVFLATTLSMISLAEPCAAATYTITDLGIGVGFAINASGQVAGSGGSLIPLDTGGSGGAFLFSGGSRQDLGTLGGTSLNGGAAGINDSGEVVGYSSLSDGSQHAFLYSGGVMQDLGLPLGASHSFATDINTTGQVVGFGDSIDTLRAFLYSGGVMQDLGTLGGGASVANAINASAQVVGWASTIGDELHAFLYSGGVMQDLGALGGGASWAWDISDGGHVVGSSYVSDGSQHAFLYSGGIMNDLGIPPGDSFTDAFGVNASGEVVGASGSGAFLYRNGVMHNLNSLVDPLSGWVLSAAFDINDIGQITGEGVFNGEPNHAFLLTPVPEPSTLALTACAALLMLRHRRPILRRGRTYPLPFDPLQRGVR